MKGKLPGHESLNAFTGFLLRKVSAASFSGFADVCAEHGLHPMHLGILTMLEAEGRVSQRELAGRAGVDTSTMVARMDVLEQQGLVKRARSGEDRRSYEIETTPAGRKLLKALRKEADAHGERVFGSLTQPEREQLHRLLQRVAEHLDSEKS